VPAKKSTDTIVPSLSVADAVSGIAAGAVKVAPAAGPVNVTLGGTFGGGGAVTVIVTTFDTFVMPRLSVATAVRL
jgi:hypothetical protein